MARTLSLLGLVVCCSSTLAPDTCGSIGNADAETQGIPLRDHMFYLDIDNPANCTGTITSWRVCYYGPAMSTLEMQGISLQNYRAIVTYSIYQRSRMDSNTYHRVNTNHHDNRQSQGFRAIRSNNTIGNQRVDGPLYEGFNCFDVPINDSINIEVGDIIGACVFNPVGDNRHQLDTVSNVSGHFLYQASPTIGSGCDRWNTPMTVQMTELSKINSRKLHIYANIESIKMPVSTTTAAVIAPSKTTKQSQAATSTAPTTILMHASSYTRLVSQRMPISVDKTVTMTVQTVTNSFASRMESMKSTSGLPFSMKDFKLSSDAMVIVTTKAVNKPSSSGTTLMSEFITTSSMIISSTKTFKQSSEINLRTTAKTINFPSPSTTSIIRPTLMPTSVPNSTIGANLLKLNESLLAPAVNLTAVVYQFSSNLRALQDVIVMPAISELVSSIANRLLEDFNTRKTFKNEVKHKDYVAGSTLLRVLDQFVLNNHNVSYPITSDNIVFRIEEVLVNDTNERISLIEGENAEISVPREVWSGLKGSDRVKVASLLFRNVSGLLPEHLPHEENTDQSLAVLYQLASPVISASFQCDNNCTTSNLSTPVKITFTHSPYHKALLEKDPNASVMCVFWEFDHHDEQSVPVLFPGRWSKEGCEANFSSNSTICKCNHLTHFAILLSARPLISQLSHQQTLALQTTGYIGVSISLVSMVATIFVFIFLKPLRTMRNYIHIQLCVTLGIAQIIFVAGVEPRLGQGRLVGGVPIGCRSVAVLLHYWFLVSFMWMLMEGVVLYVALVRVFVKHHARYVVGFTIASYGVPLLYIGAITVPLGFVRSSDFRWNTTYDYGYEHACYLNPGTSFIWSLIAPVILIFLANIGFFIMAIVIMYRHQKRQQMHSKAHMIRHWIKASISLTVVMGITWIIGFLVIEVEELFSLAYIFTIFVAFQGLFIFVTFVLLSKQVRENYEKWWKAKVAESDFLSKHFGDKTLGTSLSARNRTSLPSYNKTDRKSSGVASKEGLDQKQTTANANSYKSPIPMALMSCDDNSHGFEISEGSTPLIGVKSQMENSLVCFNVTFIPNSIIIDNKLTLPHDDNWSLDHDREGQDDGTTSNH